MITAYGLFTKTTKLTKIAKGTLVVFVMRS